MERELIEKAADEYADRIYPKTPIVGDWVDDGYDEGWNDAKNSKCNPDFIAGAEWMSQKSEWISVEDSLPDGNMVEVWVKSKVFNNQVLTYSNGRFYSSIVNKCYDNYVTHWMSIPPFNEK